MKPRASIIALAALALSSAALTASAQDTGPDEAPRIEGFRDGARSGIVDTRDYLALLPEVSDRAIVDISVNARRDGGVRLMKLYAPIPQHTHTGSTYLYVLSGTGRFQIEDREPVEVGPGGLMYWEAGVAHGMPELVDGPVTVMAFDTPFRDPDDITYINPADAPEALYR